MAAGDEKGAVTTGPRVKIMGCTCAHAFQDAMYGRGQRVHNRTAKGYRCTVCGKGG